MFVCVYICLSLLVSPYVVPTMKDISHTFSPENACDGT